jgi:hypothetical protein
VNWTVFFLRVWYDLEGLFYLIAWLFFKACAWHAFLFNAMTKIEQESGRQE